MLKEAIAEGMERCKRLLVDAVAGELKILFDGVADLMGADTEGEVPPELRVSILADACNEIYDGLRNMLLGATLKNDKLSLAVGDEAMGELKLAGRMATGLHAKVECSVQWTAPASTEPEHRRYLPEHLSTARVEILKVRVQKEL